MTKIRFNRSMPVLRVTDIVRSVEFYRDQLGFAVEMEAPIYAMCYRGECNLHLTQQPGPFVPSPIPGGAADVNFLIDGIDAYRDELRARGIDVPPAEPQSYGVRDFSVRDPDGYEIRFNEPL
jgi:catechol 2,3-dioxygenase-like lactoylglutathione lyase family enzyme